MSAVRFRTALTQRDVQVLSLVRQHYRKHGYAPTRAEIGQALGFSAPTAEGHLRALEQHGLVKLRRQWRGVFVTRAGDAARFNVGGEAHAPEQD